MEDKKKRHGINVNTFYKEESTKQVKTMLRICYLDKKYIVTIRTALNHRPCFQLSLHLKSLPNEIVCWFVNGASIWTQDPVRVWGRILGLSYNPPPHDQVPTSMVIPPAGLVLPLPTASPWSLAVMLAQYFSHPKGDRCILLWLSFVLFLG